MSRLAKKPIVVPAGVKVALKDNAVWVEGPKGKASRPMLGQIKVQAKDKEILLTRPSNSITDKSLHGTMYRQIENMISGVSKGFQKNLVIEGVGFKAELKGKILALNLGFTHIVEIEIPEGIAVKIGKPTEIAIDGVSKEGVGQFAARVRAVYEPEPYKGKGVRYANEVIRRKAGKAVVK